MILTGSKIIQEVSRGRITIDPFSKDLVNPNSYNYRISNRIKKFSHIEEGVPVFSDESIPEDGLVLTPKCLYLSSTYETIGSTLFAMSLIGRSSIGRLGLFLQITANIGHTNSRHCWTLELYALKPIKIYPRMIIGQVSFWTNQGKIVDKPSLYSSINTPSENLKL